MTLAEQRALIGRAIRQPLAPGCPTPAPAVSAASEWFPDLLHTWIDASTIGDNVLIAPPGGRILVHALQLWNVAAQTLILSNGPSAAAGSRLERLTGFGATSGYLLGLSKMPWFEIDADKPLILSLSAATQVDGFIKYRIAT